MFFYSEQSIPDDPYATNVSLLLKGDGVNNSTSIIDSSKYASNVTVNGNVSISTAQSKHGGSSIYFDGNGDYLSLSSSQIYDVGSGDFTIEAWINPAIVPENTLKSLFGKRPTQYTNGTDTIGWMFARIHYMNGKYRLISAGTIIGNGWNYGGSSGYIINPNTWTHIAFVKQYSTLTAYINGIAAYGNTIAPGQPNGLFFNNQPLVIGSTATENPGTSGYAGYIDNFRFTKGVARYTSNFTPPDSI